MTRGLVIMGVLVGGTALWTWAILHGGWPLRVMVALSLTALMWFTARSAIEAAQMAWDDRTGG